MKPDNGKIRRFDSRLAAAIKEEPEQEYPEGFANLTSLEEFFREYVGTHQEPSLDEFIKQFVWQYQKKSFIDGYKRGLDAKVKIQIKDA